MPDTTDARISRPCGPRRALLARHGGKSGAISRPGATGQLKTRRQGGDRSTQKNLLPAGHGGFVRTGRRRPARPHDTQEEFQDIRNSMTSGETETAIGPWPGLELARMGRVPVYDSARPSQALAERDRPDDVLDRRRPTARATTLPGDGAAAMSARSAEIVSKLLIRDLLLSACAATEFQRLRAKL